MIEGDRTAARGRSGRGIGWRDSGVVGWGFDFRLDSVYTLIMESHQPDPAFACLSGVRLRGVATGEPGGDAAL